MSSNVTSWYLPKVLSTASKVLVPTDRVLSKIGDLASTAKQSQRLGIYYQAQLKTWYKMLSKFEDLASIAKHSRSLGIHCQAKLET